MKSSGPSRAWYLAWQLAAAAALAGCAVGPDFVAPAPPAEAGYTRKPVPTTLAPADGVAQEFKPGAALRADWWKLFQSDALDAAVQLAFEHNASLQAATATLRESQQNLRAGQGIFYPHLDAAATAERARDEPLLQGSSEPGTVFNVVTLSGTISYPVDVFGAERRTVEGLQAQVDNQRHALQAAYLALSANVVNTSIARAAYQAQIRATEQLIELENEQLASIEAQVRAGTSAYANLLTQRSLISTNQASLAQLRQKISLADHLLAALQGVAPAEAVLPEIDLATLALPTELPLSLPSELVRQRPDILSAEALLHAASANVGVATAALYPSFGIDASFGTAGSSAASLFAGGRYWSVVPSVTAPLFHGGTLRAQRQAAIDAYDAQEADYRQTVWSAFEQVADALRALQHDAEALQAFADAQRSAGEALALLQINYRAGMVAFIDVMTADVQYHAATISYLQAVAQRQQDTVALFAALGGGWWNAAPAPIQAGSPDPRAAMP
jgi:NodT family efflux transporter outer membrane factor (OMF) lipoprotein